MMFSAHFLGCMFVLLRWHCVHACVCMCVEHPMCATPSLLILIFKDESEGSVISCTLLLKICPSLWSSILKYTVFDSAKYTLFYTVVCRNLHTSFQHTNQGYKYGERCVWEKLVERSMYRWKWSISSEWVRYKAHIATRPTPERWGAGVETQKNVRGEIGGWGRVPFNETYAPSLSTIYDGA